MKLPPITWLGTISALRRSFPRPAGAGSAAAAVAAGVLLGLGVRLIVTADIGVAPLDILLVAVGDLTGAGLGVVSVVVQGTLLTIAWRLGRPPVRATWIFVAAAGVTLQLTEHILGDVESLPVRSVMWGAGFGIISAALGLVVAGTRAGGSFELLAQAGADRGLSAVRVRTAMEIGVVVAGVALGGPLGPGSVIFAVAVGPSAAAATRFWAARMARWAPSVRSSPSS